MVASVEWLNSNRKASLCTSTCRAPPGHDARNWLACDSSDNYVHQYRHTSHRRLQAQHCDGQVVPITSRSFNSMAALKACFARLSTEHKACWMLFFIVVSKVIAHECLLNNIGTSSDERH